MIINHNNPQNKNSNIGEKGSRLADLLSLLVNHELTRESLLNIPGDPEVETEETRKLFEELSQSGDAIEERLSDWDRKYGLPEPSGDEDGGPYKGTEPGPYYDSIENQYDEAKEQGLFEVFKIIELDETNSDNHLIEAVNYFNQINSYIKEDAPTRFLNKYEQRMVKKGGVFRPKLYSMLLTIKFSEALQEKTAFIKYSHKFTNNR